MYWSLLFPRVVVALRAGGDRGEAQRPEERSPADRQQHAEDGKPRAARPRCQCGPKAPNATFMGHQCLFVLQCLHRFLYK